MKDKYYDIFLSVKSNLEDDLDVNARQSKADADHDVNHSPGFDDDTGFIRKTIPLRLIVTGDELLVATNVWNGGMHEEAYFRAIEVPAPPQEFDIGDKVIVHMTPGAGEGVVRDKFTNAKGETVYEVDSEDQLWFIRPGLLGKLWTK